MDFGGWEMPLQYAGTLAEHADVRNTAGVFDVSHLGRFSLVGPGAHGCVSRLLCNDIDRIAPGRAQYTMLLTEAGGVVDDIIVWWLSPEEFVVLPNGVNHDTVVALFREAAGDDAAVTALRADTALIAVQGPEAPALVESVLGVTPGRFRTVEAAWNGSPVTAAGTGYTGERGAEIMVGADGAADLFSAVVAGGASPCGLGARDTLRLEMGFLLWGQDLDATTTPLEAGQEWVIGWEHDFVGKKALEAEQATGSNKILIGFGFEDRRVARHGYPMRCGQASGTVASGNFSPTLGIGIGMGYVSPDPGDATTVSVEVRGEWRDARRATPPFVGR